MLSHTVGLLSVPPKVIIISVYIHSFLWFSILNFKYRCTCSTFFDHLRIKDFAHLLYVATWLRTQLLMACHIGWGNTPQKTIQAPSTHQYINHKGNGPVSYLIPTPRMTSPGPQKLDLLPQFKLIRDRSLNSSTAGFVWICCEILLSRPSFYWTILALLG